MTPNNLQTALESADMMMHALRLAHSEAIDTGDQFAEVAIYEALERASSTLALIQRLSYAATRHSMDGKAEP